MKSTQHDQPAISGQTPNAKPFLDWPDVRRVLLIRLRSIGDTVLMTPCLTAIKKFNPSIEIAVVSESLSAPLLDEHPLVDSLIVAESSAAARLHLIAQLRKEAFDVAFNMHGGTTGTLLAAMSGARRTVGYRGFRQSWMLNGRAPSPDAILGRQILHSVEQQLALLKWSGLPYPEHPDLSLAVSPDAEARVRSRLAALGVQNFAVIAPAAALESKRWPAERFAAVADHLGRSFNLSSVVIAGPGQEHVAQQVSEAARSKSAVVTGLTLKEMIALAALSRMYVGNDSGPMHIAAAMRVPLVVVFGSSNSTVWHPWTDAPYRIVEAGKAIERVSVEDMIAAVDEVVESALAATKQAL